jgi:predicted ATPase
VSDTPVQNSYHLHPVLLKRISLLPERVSDWSEYPFNVPTIASLRELEIEKPVVFFVGENGSGKSTLLEAIAVQYGFGGEGGSRNFSSATTDSVRSVDPLVRALRIAFSRRTGRGFFLRAESFFNTASAIDALGTADAYGGRSLHAQSHGESFIALAANRFNRDGLYLIDEPEAPILLGYPDAQILSFDDGEIHRIGYTETPPYQLYSRFLANPQRYIDLLLNEEPLLRDADE